MIAQIAENLFQPEIISIIGIFIVPVIGHYWYKTHKIRYEHDLKRAMIERGMSADEIDKVLKAHGDVPPPKK